MSKGHYQFEVWGAQGGTYNSAGAKGGYSIGYYEIMEEYKILYLFIGGKGISRGAGSDACISGGYNGGGQSCSTQYHTSGGGGTDIRTSYNTNYQNRLIVAGGGGGSSGSSGTAIGYGGGFSGGNALGGSGRLGIAYGQIWANGGSQTSGGSSRILTATYTNENGKFGIGGKSAGGYYYSGSGGGGYYGGGGGFDVTGGGGGSGYIGGVYNSSVFSILSNTVRGDKSFPAPITGFETGHSNNGVIKITKLIPIYSLSKKYRIFFQLFLINPFLI